MGDTAQTPDPKGGSNANEPPVTPAPAGVTPEKDPKKVQTAPEKDGNEPPKGKEKKSFSPKDDEEDIPDDAELIQLTPRALKARLTRATQKELKERFGTNDLERIEKDLKELQTFRAEKEEARKAQLTREEKLAEEKADAERRVKEAEEKAQKLEDERDIAQVSDKYEKIGRKHLAPKFLEKKSLRDGIFGDLAEYLDKHTAGQPGRITDKMVDDFYRDYVKENPEFGLKAPEVVNVPVNAGAKVTAPAAGSNNTPAGAGAMPKTARPGQPNSMTREEIAKQFGNRW